MQDEILEREMIEHYPFDEVFTKIRNTVMSQAKFKIVRQGEDNDWELWVMGEIGTWELHGAYRYHHGATKAMEKMINKMKVEEFLYDFDGKRIN